jgi:hypothetical protein
MRGDALFLGVGLISTFYEATPVETLNGWPKLWLAAEHKPTDNNEDCENVDFLLIYTSHN